MFEHTPAPWKRFLYEHGGSRIYAGENNNDLIADTYEPKANSDLIFYAPEMLDALIEGIKRNAKNGTPVECMYEAVEKATGKPIDQILKESQNAKNV